MNKCLLVYVAPFCTAALLTQSAFAQPYFDAGYMDLDHKPDLELDMNVLANLSPSAAGTESVIVAPQPIILPTQNIIPGGDAAWLQSNEQAVPTRNELQTADATPYTPVSSAVGPAPAPTPEPAPAAPAPAAMPMNAPAIGSNTDMSAPAAIPAPAAAGGPETLHNGIPNPLPSSIEAGGTFENVDHHEGDWLGAYGRIEYQSDIQNRWSGDVLEQHEFHEDGTYAAIGNEHVFDADWFTDVDVGGSTDGFFLPEWRVDGFLNRKLLDDRQLIATIGVGADHAHDDHHDESIYLGATYYFSTPWIIQGGIRINDSNPGSVTSAYGFGAVTEGSEKTHFITLRYAYGKEAYQLIGPGDTLSDFMSHDVSLTWKQWLGYDWGFDARGEYYHNPTYDRTGGTLGVFKEF